MLIVHSVLTGRDNIGWRGLQRSKGLTSSFVICSTGLPSTARGGCFHGNGVRTRMIQGERPRL
jgi:hypothetical protein